MRSGAASPAEQPDSRCLACGHPITDGQRVFKTHGLVVHLLCAVYRRRLLLR